MDREKLIRMLMHTTNALWIDCSNALTTVLGYRTSYMVTLSSFVNIAYLTRLINAGQIEWSTGELRRKGVDGKFHPTTLKEIYEDIKCDVVKILY